MYRDIILIRALLFCKSRALHNALAGFLSRANVDLDFACSLAGALATIRQNSIPVVLIPSDLDWLHFLTAVQDSPDSPSTIVLLNAFDAAIWSRALEQGAFDALALNAGQDSLVQAVRSGFRRWERRRLVRTALEQNPLSGANLLH